MTKKGIEETFLRNYPIYCKLLQHLESGLSAGLKWYAETKPELVKNRDFRPGTLARFSSVSMTVRFHFDRATEYLKNEDWDSDFVENYTFELMKESNYLGHYKDIDTSIRFYLFHSFYHQLETTIRILVDKLNLINEKGKPLDRVNKVLGCFPENFIICFDVLRNTIHNNGYYKPIHKQPKEVFYKSKHVEISFKENERTSMSTIDTIYLLIELIGYVECMLKHPEVEKIEITSDLN